MTIVNISLPLAGIAVGAIITYVLNVRARRRTYIDDLFNRAIAAMAAVEASVDYTSTVARPRNLSDAAWAGPQAWLATEGLKGWWSKQQSRNDALARVTPYRAEIATHLPLHVDATHRLASQVIAVLKKGPERA